MPINNEINLKLIFVNSETTLTRVRSYLGLVKSGTDKVVRGPFAGKARPASILNAWQTVLESGLSAWPTLLEFENDLRQKVGPMSVMKPLSERLEDIEHYYDDILRQSEPIDTAAVNAVIKEFTPAKGIVLRSKGNTWNKMKKSTSSGNPFFTKKRKVGDETVASHLRPNDSELFPDVINFGGKRYFATAILGWRGQEGGSKDDDVKQRVVWMFPFTVNLYELQFYQPAIEAFQVHDLVPAWVSMEAVDRRITRLFDTKADDDLIICTDFSKFDQHFNQDMQSAAASIIGELLTTNKQSVQWLRDVFPIKYHIPLLVAESEVWYGRHGMGSGSGGTNFDETITHRALQYEAAIRKGAVLNPNSQCLGDDGILSYPGITVEDVIATYSLHGQEMNLDKQYASSQDCIYLRRWHHKDYRVDDVCVGVYSTYRALGRLMFQERFYDPTDDRWNEKTVALRQLSIIENVKWHPMRDQFAEFCMARDKYRLGIDIPGFLDNIQTIAREAIDLMPDFLGYTKNLQGDVVQGIANWWIVQYLKKKSK